MFKTTIAFVSLLSFSLGYPFNTAIAAEEISELDFLDEAPIVTTSTTRLKQDLLNVPASVTIIDRKMIEASSATTIVELMRLVPGFQVGSKWGNESTVTYHGLSGEVNKRLHVLLNGRSLYDPALGGTLWYNLPISIDEIKSIEVVRGPNAAVYGANSFSGVINIKTFGASALEGNQVSVAYGKERGLKRVRGIHSGNSNQINYRVSLEYEQNTGIEDAKWDRYPLYVTWNDDLDQLQLNSQLAWQTDNVSHQFDVGIKQLTLGTGFEDAAIFRINPSEKDIFSLYGNYIWLEKIGLLETNKIQVSHSYYNQDGRYNYADGGASPGYTIPNQPDLNGFEFPIGGDHPVYELRDLITHRFDLEYEHTKVVSPTLQYVYGSGARYDYADSQAYFNGKNHDRYSFRVFAHSEWKALPQLVLNAGGLMEYHENIGDYFSPRVAVNYHIAPGHTLKTSWSRAYRVPSLIDEYADSYTYNSEDNSLQDWDSIGNPDLVAEEMTSLELGYLGEFFNKKLSIDLRLAYEEIRDGIDENRKTRNPTGKRNLNVPEFRTVNYSYVDIESAEMAVTFKPNKRTYFQAIAGYANAYGLWAKETLGNVNALNKAAVLDLYVPQLSSGVLVSHDFSDTLSISTQYNWVETHFAGGAGDEVDAMETWDLKVRKTLQGFGKPLEIIATVKNVKDNDYQDFDIDNLIGMETYIELKMDFD